MMISMVLLTWHLGLVQLTSKAFVQSDHPSDHHYQQQQQHQPNLNPKFFKSDYNSAKINKVRWNWICYTTVNYFYRGFPICEMNFLVYNFISPQKQNHTPLNYDKQSNTSTIRTTLAFGLSHKAILRSQAFLLRMKTPKLSRRKLCVGIWANVQPLQ